MIGLIAAIVVGMVDPITATGGIITGFFWGRRSWWAFLPLALTLAVIVTIHVLNGLAFQSPRAAYFTFTQTFSAILWACLTKLIIHLCRLRSLPARETDAP